MATPKKEAILKRAKELFFQNEWKNGNRTSLNPSELELKEAGFFSVAVSQLMRDQAKVQTEEWKGYGESRYSEDLEDFPVELIMKEGCFVVGGRGCGKTNLLKILVQRVICAKIEVKVIDMALAWKNYPLPKMKVNDKSWNVIYDLSRCSVLEARDLVCRMMANDVQEAICLTDLGMKPKNLIVLEECHNLIPSHTLRTKRFMEISRAITQGRNFGLSFLASSQRLSSVDVNLVEISGVKYWFKLEGHRNLVKARYWLDKYTVWRLRELNVGECYLQIGSKIKLLEIPMFQPRLEVNAK